MLTLVESSVGRLCPTALPKVVTCLTRFGGFHNGNEMLCAFGSNISPRNKFLGILVVDDSTLIPVVDFPIRKLVVFLVAIMFDVMAKIYGNS
jgi:hypothetical protein